MAEENQPSEVESYKMATNFSHLPLHKCLKKSLKRSNFKKLTPVQQHSWRSLIHGVDVMVAAKTGSGKTLAFLVPIVEQILRLEKVEAAMGTLAMIVSPTRELTDQIYRVLELLTSDCADKMSIASIKGGVKKSEDVHLLQKGITIMVATPGRLLDHLMHTDCFRWQNLKILVLDEADQLLDRGFEQEITQISEILPSNRQTMFFSATLNEKTRALAMKTMKTKCKFINVEELEMIKDAKRNATVSEDEPMDTNQNDGQTEEDVEGEDEEDLQESVNRLTTAENLKQGFVLCPQHMKFFVLYTMLKQNLGKRFMVFMAACHQVKFYYELLNYVSIPVEAIHGRKKQAARNQTYQRFLEGKSRILLCTDVAARGLDFRDVDWIVQFDPPVSVAQYVHRVGRTARAGAGGCALTLMRPHEVDFVTELHQHGVVLQPLGFFEKVFFQDQKKLERIVTTNVMLKKSAVIGYKSFIRSYHSYNMRCYDVNKLDLQALAQTFGLSEPPYVSLNVKSRK